MAAKNSVEKVKEFLERYNCTMVGEYKGTKAKLKIIASCGHERDSSWDSYVGSAKRHSEILCDQCTRLKYNGMRKDDFVESRERLEANGCKYIGINRSGKNVQLDFIGKCGHKTSSVVASIMRDEFTFICQDCFKQIMAKKYRRSIEEVKKIFEERNCEFLDDNYFNSSTKVKFRCECGNISYITINSFMEGHRCGCQRLRGEANNKYNPNLTDEQRIMKRNYPEYVEWRKAVYERDDYTCQCCGQKGYDIQAHHKYNYADNESLRTDVDNGITLCKICHFAYHKIYGKHDNTTEQLSEFIEMN